MYHVALTCHPNTPCPSVSQLDVRVEHHRHGGLKLTYTLSGNIRELRIPQSTTPARTDDLWRHTCFEAFTKVHVGSAYREFNFSPSGEWAFYSFGKYRADRTLEPMSAPAIVCRTNDVALEMEVRLPEEALQADSGLRLALAAVIEERNGNLSYWALHHPAAKPDFHLIDNYALELDLL